MFFAFSKWNISVFAVLVLQLPRNACLGFITKGAAIQYPRQQGTTLLQMSSTPPTFMDEVVSPRQLVSQGMEAFRRGDIQGSIDLFDKADAKVPDGSLRPYLWQRGLSLYYADRFQDASEQVCNNSLLF